MQKKESVKRKQQGFTLVEMLVAFSMFSLIMGSVIGLVVFVVNLQGQLLAQQKVINEASFIAEYISRALRDAQKDFGPTCLTASGAGWTPNGPGPGWSYQVQTRFFGSQFESRIRFLDRNNICREFRYFRDPTEFTERVSIDETSTNLNLATRESLLSDDIEMILFSHPMRGAFQGDLASPDYQQPQMPWTFRIRHKNYPNTEIWVQTVITKRNLDIEE